MRPVVRASLTLVVLCVLCSCGTSTRDFQYSGTLQAESAQVGSTIGGRVQTVYVSAGQHVRKGQPLVRFEDADQRAALAVALSQQAQALAALADLTAGPRPAEIARAAASEAQALAAFQKVSASQGQIVAQSSAAVRQAAAGVAQAQAAARQAMLDERRVARLHAQGALPSQAADDARSADAQAQAAVAAAQARLASAQAALSQSRTASPQDVIAAQRAYEAAAASRQLVDQGARPDAIRQARAAVAAARANVAAAHSRLDEMLVRSPSDGVVAALDLRPGDLVSPRARVAIIDEFSDPYVRIYLVQPDLARVKVGDTVRVRSDAAPAAVLSGRVEQIDQQAQFTPRDVQTASDRADLTFGAKVRVHDPQRLLHAGTTVSVALP